MQQFPHHYSVEATTAGASPVGLTAPGLRSLESLPPAEFDGPGDLWSPETLLLASVADCYVLTYRAVAEHANFSWISIKCSTAGVLDREDRRTRFVKIVHSVVLTISLESTESDARRLLERTESVCPIGNSLAVDIQLEADVVYSD